MPDREKVIKALEICEKKDCVLCPYTDWCGEYDDSYYDCTKLLAKDALALLKQEAVEPTLKREGRNKYYNYYVCPRCDNDVFYEQNYCSECGVEFLWEGR